jgi:hypothetical protein
MASRMQRGLELVRVLILVPKVLGVGWLKAKRKAANLTVGPTCDV